MYRLTKGKYTILVDENKLQEDINHIITTNRVKTNNQREAISTLMNLAQLGTQINNSIFDNLPYTGKNDFYVKTILRTTNLETSNRNHICLVLKKTHPNMAEVRIETATDKPVYMNDAMDAKVSGKTKAHVKPVAGHIYLERMGEKKFLYLGKVKYSYLFEKGNVSDLSLSSVLLTGKTYEEAKQELLSYDTESGRLGYVYIELTDANIKKYNLKNNNLHDIRLQYMRGRFPVLNPLAKKHDMTKSVYDAKALIPRIERALVQDLGTIPIGHPDRDLLLEGKIKDIKYCLRCVWG